MLKTMFKTQVLIYFFSLIFYTNFASSTELNAKIYSTKSKQFISHLNFFLNLPKQGHIVFGEEHYDEDIQKAEADIIHGVNFSSFKKINFSTCWEFLDYPNQKIVNSVFFKFTQNLLSIMDLFAKLFPTLDPKINHSYRHLFNVTKEFGGSILAINAPRKWKRIIIKNGLASLDKKLIPVNMELGGAFYKKRFIKAMANHAPKDKILYYFQAQSYTDSVMAESIQNANSADLKFVVLGAFHSDFNDGLVKQLKKYSSKPTVSIKIVNTKNLSKQEIKNILKPHPEYGRIADYIYLKQ